MKRICFIILGCAAIVAGGCRSETGKTELRRQVETLKRQKGELQAQMHKCRAGKERLAQQITVLSGFDPNLKGEAVYDLRRLRIHRYSGLYDKDDDGTKESLIIYIQPIDDTGDVIKAAGILDVQLWDLNKPQAQALLKEWHVECKRLKKVWFNSIMLSSYRLIFDASDFIEKIERPLTLKVIFTDYVSGKRLHDQTVLKP